MAASLEPPVGPPLGFPKCPKCSYLRSGPPHTCLQCAAASFEGIAVNSCPICNQMLEGSDCPNWLCSDPTRRIAKIHAIAYSSGPLRKTILNYKYDGRTGWSLIFGRLLVAWLDQYAQSGPIDLIVANPTYVGDGGAPFGHTERVIDAAAKRPEVAPPPAIRTRFPHGARALQRATWTIRPAWRRPPGVVSVRRLHPRKHPLFASRRH